MKLLSLQIERNVIYFPDIYTGLLELSILSFFPISVFLSMTYYMDHNQNYQFTKDKRSLYVFFIFLVLSLIISYLIQIFQVQTLVDWGHCFDLHVHHRDDVDDYISKCNTEVNSFSIYINMWGVSNLLMISAILMFKKGEDYIALYS